MTALALSRGDLLRALAVVVIWGLNFVVMKLGLQGLSPMLLGALRFTAASLPFLLFVPRPALPWRFVVGYGLAQGLGQFGFLFLGLQLGMTAGMASVVMQTQAFFTLLLAAPLLGERAKPWQWWGLLLAFGGLMTIGLAHGEGPGQMTLAGFVLTLGAAFMWAVSNLVARRAAQDAIRRSSTRRVWITSRWSARSMCDTSSPRRGCCAISPMETMRKSASRTGVRPRPVLSVMSASTTGLPGCSCRVEIMASMAS